MGCCSYPPPPPILDMGPPRRPKPRPLARGLGIVLTVLLLTLVLTGTVQVQAQTSTPAKPSLAVIGRSTEVVLYWSDLDDDSITGWQYQYGVGNGPDTPEPYGPWTDIPIPSGMNAADLYTYTVPLTGSSLWYFQVRAVNSNGNGTASDGRGTTLFSKLTTLTVSPGTVTEGDSGFTNVTLTVTLSEAAPSGGVTFDVGIVSGISSVTARSPAAPCDTLTSRPNDDICLPPDGNLVEDDEDNIFFAAGTTKKTATYRIVGDTQDENHEVAYFRLNTNSEFAPSIARLVIRDNDGATDTPVPPTATHTHTHTPVPPTATHTHTHTPVPPTATHTHTHTPVPPTATHTHTHTPVPPTATHTHTHTPVPPTATHTHTHTPVPPTATPIPPTATHTGTLAPTATPVPPTATHTHTNTPAPGDTSVPPTATHTHTNTPAPGDDTSVPPTATRTPGSSRTRLTYLRSDARYTPEFALTTTTPVVQCPAPRRTP